MCAPPGAAGGEETTGASRLRVADIFRAHGEAYRGSHALSPQQSKVLGAVMACRTAALGGFLDCCPECGFARPVHRSCRNRHCPTCQAGAQARWVAERSARVLPAPHFHVVFTLPSELRAVAQRNPTAVFDVLFEAASEVLLSLGRQRLGGELGATVVLHTWTRAMWFHPHVHCVVTGGALAGDRWAPSRSNYLFPIGVLRKRFSTRVRERLQQRWSKLDLGGACAAQSSREAFTGLLRRLRRKAWVVYAKRPFAGPSGVFRYLGQYTHRVAISSHRLVSVTASRVVFRTRGSQRVGVTPEEFIRRFLLHVLPAGYHKIRHYGLYASSHVPTRLEEARAALWRSGHAVKSEPAPDAERVASDASARGDCPVCGTALVRAPLDYAELLLDATAHGLPAGVDTS